MNIPNNTKSIKERVAAAAVRGGRSLDDVRIIAVTKTVGIPEMQALIDVGLADMGENRLQVATPKLDALKGSDVQWHMIGHLQTNKVKKAVEYFHWIHSVDSLKLAKEISKRSIAMGKVMKILFEVDVYGEENKQGLEADSMGDVLSASLDYTGIEVKGLMTMAPWIDDQDVIRSGFKKLKCLADEFNLPELSMGMTDDFEIAVEEGATMVRIGRALFL